MQPSLQPKLNPCAGAIAVIIMAMFVPCFACIPCCMDR